MSHSGYCEIENTKIKIFSATTRKISARIGICHAFVATALFVGKTFAGLRFLEERFFLNTGKKVPGKLKAKGIGLSLPCPKQ